MNTPAPEQLYRPLEQNETVLEGDVFFPLYRPPDPISVPIETPGLPYNYQQYLPFFRPVPPRSSGLRDERLLALVCAVKCREFSGITCGDVEVNGKKSNWFDARDAVEKDARAALTGEGAAKSPESTFIEELYELEPNLKTEGLERFDGYFVHWNEIIEFCHRVGGVEGYTQSPLELISRIIDQRDEALAAKQPSPAPASLAEALEKTRANYIGKTTSQLQVFAEGTKELLEKALRARTGQDGRPTVVCLCGSTRFSEAFKAANLSETIAGRIVLSIGCDTKSDSDLMALGELTEEAKAKLDELHKRKIDLADEILVLNVGGYTGSSTRSEIEYAKAHGKRIRWLFTVEDAMREHIDNIPLSACPTSPAAETGVEKPWKYCTRHKGEDCNCGQCGPTHYPFNRDRALAGAALVTRDGREVTEFQENPGPLDFPYKAKVTGVFRGFTKEGRNCPYDLFMRHPDPSTPPVPEGYAILPDNEKKGQFIEGAIRCDNDEWGFACIDQDTGSWANKHCMVAIPVPEEKCPDCGGLGWRCEGEQSAQYQVCCPTCAPVIHPKADAPNHELENAIMFAQAEDNAQAGIILRMPPSDADGEEFYRLYGGTEHINDSQTIREMGIFKAGTKWARGKAGLISFDEIKEGE